MEWSEAIQQEISLLKPQEINMADKLRIVSLLDFTRLNQEDTESQMILWADQAKSQLGEVAAVCVYPAFVKLMSSMFADNSIQIATVVNFPQGEHSLEDVLIEINQVISDGANEIDLVFPYRRYLSGERQFVKNFVAACKAACGEAVLLKIILETGVLADPAIIADAAYDVIGAGADFIKTSTGKIAKGATLDAVATMLLVVKHLRSQISRPIGVKVAGGVSDLTQAAAYIRLADNIMGKKWVTKHTFRLGSSRLIDEVLR